MTSYMTPLETAIAKAQSPNGEKSIHEAAERGRDEVAIYAAAEKIKIHTIDPLAIEAVDSAVSRLQEGISIDHFSKVRSDFRLIRDNKNKLVEYLKENSAHRLWHTMAIRHAHDLSPEALKKARLVIDGKAQMR